MINKIKAVLEEYPIISAYLINELETKSYEMFFVHQKLEVVRSTINTKYSVQIFVSHDDKLGSVSFNAYAADSHEELKEKIASAISQASAINNEPYELEEKEVYSKVVESNISKYEFSELASKIGECALSISLDEFDSLNATECFVYKTNHRTINSKGLDKSCESYSVMIEAIPTYTKNNESVEIYQAYNLDNIDFNYLEEEIRTALKDVKARYEAKKPEGMETSSVIFRAKEINEIISEFAGDLNYASKYSHSNLHSVGDDLQENANGDLITVEATNTMSGVIKSFFDSFGTNQKPRILIKDGKCVALQGSSRYAQYLKEEATGILPVIKLNSGSKSVDELKKEPYLECASMSGIQIDLFNDYIGGEVRLGYYFDGKNTYPVTGISVSAKLSEVLKELYLSKEVVSAEDFEGPKFALMKGFTIL